MVLNHYTNSVMEHFYCAMKLVHGEFKVCSDQFAELNKGTMKIYSKMDVYEEVLL